MSWQISVFGVRHLSPMGAWQLRAHLDRVQPDVVLIEGLDDATELIPDMTRKATKPPIAILAYTDTLPVRTLVYPLATYSPEYQAIVGTLNMNPEDMKEAGIAQGGNVRVRSEHGEVTFKCVEGKTPSGMIFIPYGPPTCRLMGQYTDGTGMPLSKGWEVEVELLEAPASDSVVTAPEEE